MAKIILLQLFWLSFAVIGLAVLLISAKLFPKFRKSYFYQHIKKAHFLVQAFVSFVFGVSLFCVPVSLAYIFEWPLMIIELMYLAALAFSVGLLAMHSRVLLSNLRLRFKWKDKRWLGLGFAGVIIIGTSYVLSLHTGAPFDSDTPTHLGKIQLMLNLHHYTLQDPYMGYNGITDLRYSTNILDGIQVIAAHLLHWPAYKVWQFSNAFNQLLIWLSLFFLTIEFLPSKVSKSWSYAVLSISPFVYTGYFFFYADQPHDIVLAFVCLLFIGIKYLIQKGSPTLLIIASILIAEEHALVASVSLVYLFLLCLFLLLDRKSKMKPVFWKTMAISAVILFIPVAANLLSPSRSTEVYAQAQTLAPGLNAMREAAKQWKGITLPNITFMYKINKFTISIYSFVLPIAAILLIYAFLMKRLKPSKLKTLMFLLISLIGVAISNLFYISFIGYYYLVTRAKDRAVKIEVFLAIIFFAIIAYDPIALTLAHNRVPLWTIARFEDFNMFAYTAPLIGIVFLMDKLRQYWGIKKINVAYIFILAVFISGFAYPAVAFVKMRDIVTFGVNNSNYRLASSQEKQLSVYEKMSPYFRNQVVYSTDAYFNEDFPSVHQEGYTGLLVEQLSNEAENYKMRLSCESSIFKNNMDLGDLESAKITRVVLTKDPNFFSPDTRSIADKDKLKQAVGVASTKSYLKLIAKVKYDYIYKVVYSPGLVKPDSANCNIPYGQ